MPSKRSHNLLVRGSNPCGAPTLIPSSHAQRNTKRIRKPGGWSTLRRQLATWEKPALLVLVKDLYEAAAENRDFIQARCQTGESGGEALEKYRHKIVEQFYPVRGEPNSN